MSALLHHGAKHLKPSTSGGQLRKVPSSQQIQQQRSQEDARSLTQRGKF